MPTRGRTIMMLANSGKGLSNMLIHCSVMKGVPLHHKCYCSKERFCSGLQEGQKVIRSAMSV